MVQNLINSPFFQMVVNNAPIVLFSVDRDGVFTLSEGRALINLGLKPGEAVGASVFELYADYPSILDSIRRSLSGETTSYQVEVGKQIFVTVCSPLENDDGEIVGVVGVASDHTELRRAEKKLQNAHDDLGVEVETRTRLLRQEITERKFIEKELIEARELAEIANRIKTDLLANMSHELRTPLNAIIGFSSTMKSEMFGALNEKYLDYASDINRSGVHLLELINDLLDVSAIEAGKLELQEVKMDVRNVVEATLHMLNELVISGNIHLTCTADEDLPMLLADKRRITQILLNLLSNAIKFTLPDGEVSLTASLDGERAHVFTVTDTGIGMDDDELANAMSKFGQVNTGLGRKQEGTGLGLPLTRELVELHGGTFKIESEKGKGTTVTVQFPQERTEIS